MAEGPQIPLPDQRRPAWIERTLAGATGRGVRVAMVDSGLDPAWQDPRIQPGMGLTTSHDSFDLTYSADVRDRIGHGTACTDIVLGMAPGTEILPLRVFGTQLETSPEVVVAALEHAIEARVSVVNLSLGSLLDRALRPLYRACEQARQAGVVVVSAIHLGEGWSYPAVFENTLGVAAGRFTSIFDFEYLPEEGAECRAQGERQVRWLGGPRRLFGSSFAAPHITALVALFLERFPGSDLTQIRALLARHALRQPSA